MSLRFGPATHTLLISVVLLLAAPVGAQIPQPPPTDAAVPPPPESAATPAPPPPTPLPTSGEAVQLLSVLDNACLPLIGGGAPKAVARAAGLKINHDGDLYLPLDGGKKITVVAPTPANPSNCSITIDYDVGDDDALLDGLKAWVARRPTPLPPDKVAEKTPDDHGVAIISTWVNYGPAKTEGLVFIQHKKADGGALNDRVEQAQILFSIRPS